MKTKQLLIAALLATGMTAQAQTAVDISAFTADTELEYAADGWTYSVGGGTETKFNGTVKGTGTQVTLNIGITVRNTTADEAMLTFDNVNLKMTDSGIGILTGATNGKTTVNLKDVQIEGSSDYGTVYSSVSTSPVTVKVDDSSKGSSKLTGTEDCTPLNFISSALTVNGGTKGLEVTSTGSCIYALWEPMTLSGKIAITGGGNDVAVSCGDCEAMVIGGSVTIATSHVKAVDVGEEGSIIGHVFQWAYDTAPAAGKIVVKEEGVEKATFVTDGKVKTFATGVSGGKIYTLFYTPTGGTEQPQKNSEGHTQFRPIELNGIEEFIGMTDAPSTNSALDLGTITAAPELAYTADGWTYTQMGGKASPFDGTLKGGSKDAPLSFSFPIIVRNNTTDEAVLTFDNTNLKMTDGVEFMTSGTNGKVTVNLKDARLESSNGSGLIHASTSCNLIGVKVDESSNGPSKLIETDGASISFSSTPLTVDGGTKGLEIESTQTCINNVNKTLTVTGKVTLKSGNVSAISSYNTTGVTIGEEVAIASGYNAISIGADGVALNPLFQWKYKTAPAAGKLVIKADGVEKITFITDGKLKVFGIGGVIGKEYNVYYTPDGGTEKAQQDADGTTAFKATANGLNEYSGMMEGMIIGALDLSTLTGDAILSCTDGKWKYALDQSGATEFPFSGVVKGGSKDTELAFEHGLLVKKMVSGASVLTFDNVNLKLSKAIKFQTTETVDLLTVNLKDSKITGEDGFAANAGAACGPILVQADPSSTTASTIDTGEDGSAIHLAGTPLTIDGGTAGLTLIGRQALSIGVGKVELKGKLSLMGTSLMGLTMSQPCTDLSVAESVTISGRDGIYGQATWTSAALQCKFIDAPAAGSTIEVKSGTDVVATFTADGNRRYFAVGALLNKEYTVWYTPAGGTATQQQDNTGTSVFKATANGLLAMEGMEDIASDGIQNTETTVIPAISYVYSVDGRLVKTVPAAEYSTLKNGLDRGIYIVNGEKMAVE